MWNNWNAHTLLTGVKNDSTISKITTFSHEKQKRAQKDLHTNIHSNFITKLKTKTKTNPNDFQQVNT